MQSTWENLVDYDLSESGVRPLTLRELVEMGFDLDAFLDQPLGYSQSNGTIELRERLAALYPGADLSTNRGHQRHLGGQLPHRPQPAARRRRGRDGGAELHAGAGRRAQPGRDDQDVLAAAGQRLGAGLGRVRARRDAEHAAALPLEPQQPDRIDPVRTRRCGASSTAARRPGRGSSPTRCISAPRSTARARRASGA